MNIFNINEFYNSASFQGQNGTSATAEEPQQIKVKCSYGTSVTFILEDYFARVY